MFTGSIRSSRNANVRLAEANYSKAHNIHLSLSGQSPVSLRSVSGQSQVVLRALCAYFIRQMEPKILRLVFNNDFKDFIFHLL